MSVENGPQISQKILAEHANGDGIAEQDQKLILGQFQRLDGIAVHAPETDGLLSRLFDEYALNPGAAKVAAGEKGAIGWFQPSRGLENRNE